MRYVEITIEQMREHLKAEKGWYEPNPHPGFEYVFQYNLPYWDGAVIKVLTSINKTGRSRAKGKDAIRVCGVDLINKRGLHKSITVFRVEGWRDNLKRAVKTIMVDLHKRKPKKAPLEDDFDLHFDEDAERDKQNARREQNDGEEEYDRQQEDLERLHRNGPVR